LPKDEILIDYIKEAVAIAGNWSVHYVT
jgi:hypothetical protein